MIYTIHEAGNKCGTSTIQCIFFIFTYPTPLTPLEDSIQ